MSQNNPFADRVGQLFPGQVVLPPERCAPAIYDEFTDGVDPDLDAAIDRFADQGVFVHVQLVESMTDEGYTAATGEQYVNDVVDGCGWDTDNTITFVVAGDPRFFNVTTWGRQSDFDNADGGAVERFVEAFRGGLSDGGPDSFQDDAARALNNLYREEFSVAEAAPTRPIPADRPITEQPQVLQPPRASDEGLDVPVGSLVAGGGGLVAAAVVGGRLYLGRQVGNIRRGFEYQAQADKELIVGAYFDAQKSDRITQTLPGDDAVRLRELEAGVNSGYTTWVDRRDKTAQFLKGLRWKAVPSRRQAEGMAESYEAGSSQYRDTVNGYLREVAAVQEMIQVIDDLRTNTADQSGVSAQTVAGIKAPADAAVAQDRRAAGERLYDVGALESDLAAANTLIAEADILREDNYVEKPHALYSQAQAQLQAVDAYVAALPEFHAGLIESAQTNNAEQTNRTAALENLVTAVADIKAKFDDSCWGDLEADLAAATDSHATINGSLTTVANPALEFSIAKLNTDKVALDGLTGHETAFEAREQSILQWQAKIHELRDELPDQLDELLADQQSAAEFVTTNAPDIEDKSEQVVHDLRARITALQKAVTVEKPKYLEVDKDRAELVTELAAARRQAEVERDEMIRLRSAMQTLPGAVALAISAAEVYDNHADVDDETDRFIDSLNVPDAPRTQSRLAMREAERLYEAAIADAKQAAVDARADIDRAERIREAARQAEIARQAAERAAEQARQQAIQEAAQRAADSAREAAQAATRSTSHSGQY